MSAKSHIEETMTRRRFVAALPMVPMAVSAMTRRLRRSSTYDFSPVRQLVEQAISAGEATGMSIAVVHNGQIVWEEGFGWADREAGRRATAHTPFSLASMSKPFTAAAMMTLAAEGKLSLDESANSYLGDDRLSGTNAHTASVRQLGAHAAGLPSLFEMYPADSGVVVPTSDAILQNYGSLAYAPGRVYEYSNIGYEALGAIASRLTRMSFGEFITRRLLRPLGLRDSFFDTHVSGLARAAARYDQFDRPIPYYTTATPPSGELYVSAHDLAIFALFNLGSPIGASFPVLRERWIAELHKPVFRGPGAGSSTFGWFWGRGKSGLPVLYKDGGQPGVVTMLYIVPSEDLACVVLTNRSDDGKLVVSVANQTTDIMLPGWTTPDTSMTVPESPFIASADWVGKWTGNLHNGEVHTQVALEIGRNSHPRLSLDGRAAAELQGIGLEGQALVGTTSGTIDAPDAIRNGANALSVKLFREGNLLRGRILAEASSPGKLAVIPFTMTLERVSASAHPD